MIYKQKTIIFMFLVFLIYDFSYSQRNKGSDFVNQMKEYEKNERGETCLLFSVGTYCGFIVGIVDSFDGISFSTPFNSDNRQLFAVVAKYLNENPEKWNEPASYLVVTALKKAFPLNN